MPIPGPRNQAGPAPGYRNPGAELPDRINHWKRPGPVYWPGRTPGFMAVTLRGCVLGYGTMRRMWRQSVNYAPGQAPFSWTENGNIGAQAVNAVGVTRALRYMTKSVYAAAGTDNSRYARMHTQINHENAYKPVTIGAGQKRSAPTVRNRITSFGSRVPTLNQSISAAESQQGGGGK